MSVDPAAPPASPMTVDLAGPEEEARLAAVRRYDILDTPPDGAFDRITALAARVLDVPIAIVSIVDVDRIWFKSHHGVDVDQVDRDPGLCASAILQEGPWLVEDARTDPRTLANPLVAGELGLRFYLGIPLHTADGHNLGTLCVLDRQARQATERQIRDLSDLAAVVVDELELRRAGQEIVSLQLDQLERSEAERDRLDSANRRLHSLQDLSAGLAGALTPSEVARTTAEQTMAALGGNAIWVALLHERGDFLVTTHTLGYEPEVVERFRRIPIDAALPIPAAARNGEALFFETNEEILGRFPLFAEVHPAVGGAAILPLVADGRVLGAFGVCFPPGHHLGAAGREFLLTAGRLCSQALAQSRRFEHEHCVAEILQRSLLPTGFPTLRGLAAAACYQPGAGGLAVGGDWYDVFALADGRVGIAIGDVVGRGLTAAAGMGQLRNALRAFALDGEAPAEVVYRLSRLLSTFDDTDLATLLYGIYDPRTRTLAVANAGHPPPLLVGADRSATYVEATPGPPLGVLSSPPVETPVVLDAGTTIVFYTDGLIERRGTSIDDGMSALARLATGVVTGDLEQTCRQLIAGMGGAGADDDIAILVMAPVPDAPLTGG